MPIEDDAWGTPVPEAPDAPQATTTTGPPPPSRSGRPGWLRPPIALAGLAVVVVVVVVVIVASGGGSSTSSGLSKAQWIQKADAICGKTFPQQSADQSNGNLAGAVNLAQQTLTQIRALGLPTSGADQVKSIEAQEQRGTTLLEQAVANANSDPTSAQSDVQQAQSAIQGAQTTAGQFGMQVCNAGQ
jgi:hypothetical protein